MAFVGFYLIAAYCAIIGITSEVNDEVYTFKDNALREQIIEYKLDDK